jgi:photosystem II stability/assembly factor-like uncharacterized protein
MFNGEVKSRVEIAITPVLKRTLFIGSFTLYNEVSANRIVCLNVADEIADSFNSGSGFNNIANTAINYNNKFLIGGEFTEYDGTTVNRIVLLNIDGTIDTSFNTGSGFNGDVNTIVQQSDGKILIGGNFTQYNGASANRIIRLNPDGSVDNIFGSGFNDKVNAIVIQKNAIIGPPALDGILIGGNFTQYRNTIVNRIVRLNINNGNIDTSFQISTNIGTEEEPIIITGFNDIVYTIFLSIDFKIYIGGKFTFYKIAPCNRIVRLFSNGIIDNSFFIGDGFDNEVNSITKGDTYNFFNQTIVVGGAFNFYKNIPFNKIVSLNSFGGIVDSPDCLSILNSETCPIEVDPEINTEDFYFEQQSIYNGRRVAVTSIRSLNADNENLAVEKCSAFVAVSKPESNKVLIYEIIANEISVGNRYPPYQGFPSFTPQPEFREFTNYSVRRKWEIDGLNFSSIEKSSKFGIDINFNKPDIDGMGDLNDLCLIIGSAVFSNNLPDYIYVQVFKFFNNNWFQLGGTLNFEIPPDSEYAGVSVAASTYSFIVGLPNLNQTKVYYAHNGYLTGVFSEIDGYKNYYLPETDPSNFWKLYNNYTSTLVYNKINPVEIETELGGTILEKYSKTSAFGWKVDMAPQILKIEVSNKVGQVDPSTIKSCIDGLSSGPMDVSQTITKRFLSPNFNYPINFFITDPLYDNSRGSIQSYMSDFNKSLSRDGEYISVSLNSDINPDISRPIYEGSGGGSTLYFYADHLIPHNRGINTQRIEVTRTSICPYTGYGFSITDPVYFRLTGLVNCAILNANYGFGKFGEIVGKYTYSPKIVLEQNLSYNPPSCAILPPNTVDRYSDCYKQVLFQDPACCSQSWDVLCQQYYDVCRLDNPISYQATLRTFKELRNVWVVRKRINLISIPGEGVSLGIPGGEDTNWIIARDPIDDIWKIGNSDPDTGNSSYFFNDFFRSTDNVSHPGLIKNWTTGNTIPDIIIPEFQDGAIPNGINLGPQTVFCPLETGEMPSAWLRIPSNYINDQRIRMTMDQNANALTTAVYNGPISLYPDPKVNYCFGLASPYNPLRTAASRDSTSDVNESQLVKVITSQSFCQNFIFPDTRLWVDVRNNTGNYAAIYGDEVISESWRGNLGGKNGVTFLDDRWAAIDTTSDWPNNGYTMVLSKNNNILRYTSFYGETEIIPISGDWVDISISDSGKYQTALMRNSGIFVSNNFGESWVQKNIIKNWRAIDMSLDGQFQTAVVQNDKIYISRDYGNTWKPVNNQINYPLNPDLNNKYWTSIALNGKGDRQVATAKNDQVYVSNDYGFNWNIFNGISRWNDNKNYAGVSMNKVPLRNYNYFISTVNRFGKGYFSWNKDKEFKEINITAESPNPFTFQGKNVKIASSYDAIFQTLVVNDGSLYRSTNYGATWEKNNIGIPITGKWKDVALNHNGKYQTAITSGNIYTSKNFGISWSAHNLNKPWQSVAMSAFDVFSNISYDKDIRIATTSGEKVYQWSSGSNAWFVITDPLLNVNKDWRNVAISANGSFSTIVAYNDKIFTKMLWNTDWSGINITEKWMDIDMSLHGQFQTAVTDDGKIYLSHEFGHSWEEIDPGYVFNSIKQISVSDDGKVQVILADDGQTFSNIGRPYISEDFGITWRLLSINPWNDPTDTIVISKNKFNGEFALSTLNDADQPILTNNGWRTGMQYGYEAKFINGYRTSTTRLVGMPKLRPVEPIEFEFPVGKLRTELFHTFNSEWITVKDENGELLNDNLGAVFDVKGAPANWTNLNKAVNYQAVAFDNNLLPKIVFPKGEIRNQKAQSLGINFGGNIMAFVNDNDFKIFGNRCKNLADEIYGCCVTLAPPELHCPGQACPDIGTDGLEITNSNAQDCYSNPNFINFYDTLPGAICRPCNYGVIYSDLCSLPVDPSCPEIEEQSISLDQNQEILNQIFTSINKKIND